jgi:hypothetical protein
MQPAFGKRRVSGQKCERNRFQKHDRFRALVLQGIPELTSSMGAAGGTDRGLARTVIAIGNQREYGVARPQDYSGKFRRSKN